MKDANNAVKELQHLLAKHLRSNPAASGVVAEILAILPRIERGLTHKPRSRKYDALKSYKVTGSPSGEVLIEMAPGRTGRTGTYRCPRNVYTAAARILERSQMPISIDELVEQVGQKTGAAPGAFQVRLAARFWLSLDPPLIRRNRARYTAMPRMMREAEGAWEALKSYAEDK